MALTQVNAYVRLSSSTEHFGGFDLGGAAGFRSDFQPFAAIECDVTVHGELLQSANAFTGGKLGAGDGIAAFTERPLILPHSAVEGKGEDEDGDKGEDAEGHGKGSDGRGVRQCLHTGGRRS